VIVVLIATLAVGLKNLRSLYDASGAVVHTHEVTAGLEQLLLPAVDAETGERGFIITGTDNYLEPYERARNQMASVLARVRALTATDPNIRRTWIACPR
jgi:CHASE3 domain sensor protein